MSRRAPTGERGFVLSLVIFAVAALSIAGTALFLVVQSEGAMADSGADTSSAFHLANAGLARYMGETFGPPTDSVVYDMGGGTVTVSGRKVMSRSRTEDVYLITSEARVRDRRVSGLQSTRAVHQFATLRRQPFNVMAAVVMPALDVRTNNVQISGADQCGVAPVAGMSLAGSYSINGSVTGSPNIAHHSYAATMGTTGLDWAALQDPALPFDYELPDGSWPNYLWGIGPGEYPTIRVDGNFTASWFRSGRGLLVVTGELTLSDNFSWDGAIIAGSIRSNTNARVNIQGTLMTGFGGQQSSVHLRRVDVSYNSCSVLSAAEGISMLSPISNTWWEADT